MSAAGVCGLCNECGRPLIESVIVGQGLHSHDGVRQVLVEIACLEEANVWQEVLEQNVVVVGVLSLEMGVTDAPRGGRRAGVNLAGRRANLLGIRASQAASVDQP